MDYTKILAIIAVTVAAVIAVPELTINPPGPIKQGDTVIITCVVQDKGPLDIVRITRNIEGKDHEISTNEILKSHFENTHRYKVSEWNPATGKVVLTISNIKGADAGNIGCRHLPGDKGAYEDLIVKVPVESVELLYVDEEGALIPAAEGQTVRMKKGLPSGIVCKVVVEGSDFEPDIKVFVDEVESTDMFRMNNTMLKDSQHGLLKYHFAADLEWRPKKPSLSYNGKTIRCEAKMPDFEATSKSVNIEVLYPPEVICNEEMYAKIGETFRVYCVATMHPAPQADSVIWTWGKKPNRGFLSAGQKDKRMEAKMTPTEEGSQYEISLEITGVEAADFKNYKIEVSNGVGNAENSVALVEAVEVIYNPAPKPSPKANKEQLGNPDMNTIVGSFASSISGTILVLLAAMLSAAVLRL